MKDTGVRTAVCPICAQAYHGRPAVSRLDNTTLICPDCGTRQALESIGVKPEEQEKILRTIHQNTRQYVPGQRMVRLPQEARSRAGAEG